MGGFLIKDACSGEKRGAVDMVSEQATMRNIDCTEMRERRSVLTCRPPCSSPGNLCGGCTKAQAEHRLYPNIREFEPATASFDIAGRLVSEAAILFAAACTGPSLEFRALRHDSPLLLALHCKALTGAQAQ